MRYAVLGHSKSIWPTIALATGNSLGLADFDQISSDY